ncbi:MAG: phage tail protein [Anaerolineae bacterium]|nr:phage tail protein [Anaerolineae bacterium]
MTKSFVTKLATAADPVPEYKFWVEIDGIVEAEFKECTGLSLERDIKEIEEGGVNDHWQILPGRTHRANIVLKQGVAQSSELWNWYQAGLHDAKVGRKDFSVLLRGVDGTVVKTWSFSDGFPAKWEGPALNVEQSQVAIETLEIAMGSGQGGGSAADVGRPDAAGEKRINRAADPQAAGEGAARTVDREALAERVYQLLREEARVERERLGRFGE